MSGASCPPGKTNPFKAAQKPANFPKGKQARGGKRRGYAKAGR